MANIKDVRNSLIDIYLEMIRPEYNGKLETFEVYSERVKSQINATQDELVSHLQHGYELILNKIAKKIE